MRTRQKERILIIESGEDERRIIKHMLTGEYQVTFVETMDEGIECLKVKGRYQAVLVDVFTPHAKEFEFLKEIKKEKYSHPPIVAMVEDYDARVSRKLLKLGVEEYVLKPLDKAIVLNRIRNVIARSNLFKIDDNKYELRYDSLTGLFNRHTMYNETAKMMRDNKGVKFCVVTLDIINFSLYNLTLSEKEGDKLLCYIAEYIHNSVKKYDLCTYGRIGADVYCICLPYDEEFIEKQIEMFKSDILGYRKDYLVEIAAGLYIVDDPETSVEVMFNRAHMAAYKNKSEYMQKMHVYDDTMEKKANSEQEVLNDMHRALEKEEFVVYLQPKCSLKTGKVYGAEALVRWIHPEKGLLTPGVFIPVFEKHGFISKLDCFMWEKVCMLIREWMDNGVNVMPVSVNLSRISLYNPLIATVLVDIVEKYNVPPSLINIEITESAYMDNPNMMKNILNQLKSSGFTVMMDDFGSGYSSLNTLKDLDVDVVKIDMNFLPQQSNKIKGEKILSSVISMIDALNMESIIEGVETVEQKQYLENIGCDMAQGYLFSKPIPVDLYCQKYLMA